MTELLVGSVTPRISVIADPTKSRYPLDWARATRREDSGWAPNGGLDNETTLGAIEEEPRSRSSGQHRLPDPGLDILDLAGENVNDGIHERQLIA